MSEVIMSLQEVMRHISDIAAGQEPTRDQLRALEMLYRYHTANAPVDTTAPAQVDYGILPEVVKFLKARRRGTRK